MAVLISLWFEVKLRLKGVNNCLALKFVIVSYGYYRIINLDSTSMSSKLKEMMTSIQQRETYPLTPTSECGELLEQGEFEARLESMRDELSIFEADDEWGFDLEEEEELDIECLYM